MEKDRFKAKVQIEEVKGHIPTSNSFLQTMKASYLERPPVH